MEEGLKLIVKYQRLLYLARYEDWIKHGVFTAGWWMLLGVLIIPWFLWYRLIDKKRLQEMLLYAFTTSFVGLLLDEIGGSLTFWAYPIKLVPFFPRLISANYTLVPVIFTLVYQYFPRWKSFIIANIFLTIVFSFVLEPTLVWLKLYVLISWKYIYSIPVYFFAAIILKAFADKIKSVQKRYLV